jgi:hypothetical protein
VKTRFHGLYKVGRFVKAIRKSHFSGPFLGVLRMLEGKKKDIWSCATPSLRKTRDFVKTVNPLLPEAAWRE